MPEAVGPLQVQTGAEPDQAHVLDIPVSERLRRLAARYVNNPESLVNGVRLESGPSGRFQAVITVEIGDNLAETIDRSTIAVSQRPTEMGTEVVSASFSSSN